MKAWHLMIDAEPLKGSFNMAVDDFFFRSLTDEPRTFVRFYQWERPTASLGFSQKIEKVIDLEFCRQNGIDVVRRITGGKLVLHHWEITYSVCSSDTEVFTPTLGGSYKIISQALMLGLGKMGLDPSLAEKAPLFYAKGDMPCFSHPAQDEIEVNGKKIVGSAQKRVGAKFLQHGSIPLAHDESLLKAVSLLKSDSSGLCLTSLGEALGRPVDFEGAVRHLVAGFREFFGATLSPFSFGRQDTEKILVLQKCKYDADAWTYFGRE